MEGHARSAQKSARSPREAHFVIGASAVLLILNLVAAGIHYFFQVSAVRTLGAGDLGVLVTWMTVLSLALGLAVVVQYWANLARGSVDGVKRLLVPVRIIYGVSACVSLGAVYGVQPFSPVWALILCLPAYVSANFLIGSIQRRMDFVAFGLAGVALALPKLFALGVHSPDEFMRVVAQAPALALPLVMLLEWVGRDREITVQQGAPLTGLVLALVSGVAFVWFVSFDFLNVRLWMSPEAAGEFARLQLFSKILYFGPSVLLQITLPHYVALFTLEPVLRVAQQKKIRRLEYSVIALCVVGSIACGVFGPALARAALGTEGLSRLDVILACLAMVPLYWTMNAIQIAVSAGRVKWALLVFGSTFLSPILASAVHWGSLNEYLWFSLGMNAVFGVFGAGVIRRVQA